MDTKHEEVFKFMSIDGNRKVSVEVPSDSNIYDTVEAMEDWLRAAGFNMEGKTLIILEDGEEVTHGLELRQLREAAKAKKINIED